MKLFTSLFAVFIFLLAVSPAYAVTTRGGQTVDVAKGEIVSGNLFVGGNTVTIDGTVTGDLFCGAQRVVITGTVNGDVICGAETIDITGAVKRNAIVGAQVMTVEKSASIAGELIFAGQTLTNNGTVVGGVSKFIPKREQMRRPPRIAKRASASPVGFLFKLMWYIALSFIVLAVAPKWIRNVLAVMRARFWPLVGSGCLIMIAVPIGLILVAITIIGIPIAILGGLAFGLAISLAHVAVALWTGEYVLDLFHAKKKSNAAIILTGVPISLIAFAIPVIGWLAGLFATLWGLGAIIESRKK